MKSTTNPSEQAVQRSILQYLFLLKEGMFWRNNTVGVYDPIKKIYRKNTSPHSRNGVADILGVYRGHPVAIEVKSKTGRLSESQKSFLEDFKKHGGIAIVARSVDDVRSRFPI